MREIKFQFLYKGLPFSAENQNCNWFKKVYTLDQLIESPLSQLSDVHGQATLVAKRQYTGLKDSNGVEIYDGDIVCWGENIETVMFDDGFYQTETSCLDSCMEVIGNIHQNHELLEQTL